MAPTESIMKEPGHFIIRDIYEDERATERFEEQLEDALKRRKKMILIEPIQLGSDTRNHILIGNRIHKTAVLSGLASLICLGANQLQPNAITLAHFSHLEKVSLLLAAVGWSSTAVYDLSWQCDPLSRYQVLKDNTKISIHAIRDLRSTTALVLERKDDTVRRYLHNSISFLTLALFSWRIYNLVKD